MGLLKQQGLMLLCERQNNNSERQNNNKSRKTIWRFKICILMSQISIWSHINQQDFWIPLVFYLGKELRLGALS